jgi:tRNA A-37 threonylcarbamoyl transferase component Bud32
MLGEYELLERLGAGGMGEVYRARHVRLDKLVALKLLPAQALESKERVTRFLREMKAIGSLDHANVIEAYDAGEEGGVVYLAMKLLDGIDLGRLVRERGPLPVAEACDCVRQAARGLQYLHERGLVHRDLKPSNLMRTADGVVKVLDLGLARWHADETPAGDLTAIGQGVGTPDYIAPEQVRGEAVDGRADLYGLGGTLFFLLTGRAPFAHRHGLFAKMEAHRHEAPPDVRALRPEVPAALADLVDRLLAKDPADRPQTPAEVAAALTAFAGSPSPEAALPPQPAAARLARSRRPWLVAAACALVVLGLVALAFWRGWPGAEPPAPPGQPGNGGASVAKVQVLSLDVKHFANVRGEFDQPHGLMGKDSFVAGLGDSVTVEARLSQPAYAYLIAFRPDGIEEVCYPEKEDEPPPRTDRPRYPSVSRGVNYGLNEGEGLQVFAVVVSSKPLPAYKEWRRSGGIAVNSIRMPDGQIKPVVKYFGLPKVSPWKKSEAPAALAASTVGLLGSPPGEGALLAASALVLGRTLSPTPPGVVWWDNGEEVVALTAEDPTGQRGKGQEVSGKTQVANLTDWLRQAPEAEAVAVVGFAVVPKDRR